MKYSIRLDESQLLGVRLPIERAERVARRAVGEHGRFNTAEILDADGEVVSAYARLDLPEEAS